MSALHRYWGLSLFILSVYIVAGCGGGSRLLEDGGWRDADVAEDADLLLDDADIGHSDADINQYDADADDVSPPDGDIDDAPADDADVDVDEFEDADVREDADLPPTELSCITGAYCAMCCPTDDFGCQLGCVAEAPPSVVVDVTAVVTCVATSGCGSAGGSFDYPCVLAACQSQLEECSGSAAGTVGCIGTAWCLYSSGCTSLPACAEQGLCYQRCLDDARPEVVDVALELLSCVGASCSAECAGGFSTPECATCLGTTCGPTLAGCLGM